MKRGCDKRTLSQPAEFRPAFARLDLKGNRDKLIKVVAGLLILSVRSVRRRCRGFPVALGLIGLAVAVAFGASGPSNKTRASVSSSGEQANESNWSPSISADGRFVAFTSDATNLVSGNRNNVLVRDMATRTTSRVSVNSSGAQIDDQPYSPAISANGRFVAFTTAATNLVPGDADRDDDVFVHDRATGTTTPASVNSSGALGDDDSGHPALSADGRFVAFSSFANNFDGSAEGIFIHDRVTGQTTRASVSSAGVPGDNAWGLSLDPSISADGRFVAFCSGSANLAPGDTNRRMDVFVRDRVAATTTRVSVGSGGAEGTGSSCSNQGADISTDGRVVAFDSDATNLVPGDTNGTSDVFVRDRPAGTTRRVSVDSEGREATSPYLSGSRQPTISSNGRFVAFVSTANNLVDDDLNPFEDIFLHDRATGKTTRVSAATGGGYARSRGGGDGIPSVSGDGRFVAFESEVALAPDDTNDKRDIYVHDRTVNEITVVRLSLVIKKRRGKILVSGELRPRLPNRKVTVALFRKRKQGKRFVKVGAKRATLDAASNFRVTFRRPRSGWCKVTSRFPGGPNLSSDFRSFTVRCKL